MSAHGSAAVRVLAGCTLRTLVVGPLDTNVYLLTCHATGAQLLVDAADEPDRLLALIREGSPDGRLDLVVTTHRHADHLDALAAVLSATGAPHAAGAADARAVADAAGTELPRALAHGDRLAVGALTLEVLALRGHTPGGVALLLPEREGAGASSTSTAHLLTGDSLFPGGPGHTAGPADFASLMTDLTERVFDVLDPGTRVCPGHGAGTTLGAERPNLPTWWSRGW
ncbi:MAG TPA: MBL fold metallo-hydrolase [Cellulomonas sp.]